jgi:putative flippase GtrA
LRTDHEPRAEANRPPDIRAKHVIQFVKYGISGGVATLVHLTVFYLMAIWVFPALSAGDPVSRLLGQTAPLAEIDSVVRAKRAAWDNGAAFLVSNFTAYILNVLWVFKRGRHHWVVEILMFYVVSGVSMLIGTAMQTWLIVHMSLSTTLAFGTNMITALMINYGMRKFIIFKG